MSFDCLPFTNCVPPVKARYRRTRTNKTRSPCHRSGASKLHTACISLSIPIPDHVGFSAWTARGTTNFTSSVWVNIANRNVVRDYANVDVLTQRAEHYRHTQLRSRPQQETGELATVLESLGISTGSLETHTRRVLWCSTLPARSCALVTDELRRLEVNSFGCTRHAVLNLPRREQFDEKQQTHSYTTSTAAY